MTTSIIKEEEYSLEYLVETGQYALGPGEKISDGWIVDANDQPIADVKATRAKMTMEGVVCILPCADEASSVK